MCVIVLIFWFVFWSFASVLLTRLSWNKLDKKELKSVSLWFSHCPKCKKRLGYKNLVPLFSYLYQWWKCSFCNSRISSFYPILEVLSWLIFLSTYFIFPFSSYLELFFWLIINRLLLLIIIYDFKKYELHLPSTILLLIVSILFQFLNIFWDYKIAFFSSISLLGIFFIIYYLSKLYVKNRYKKNQSWIWSWDIILSFVLWTLFSFVFEFNSISFSVFNLIKILLIFVLISSLLGILIRLINIFVEKNNVSKKEIKKSVWADSINIIPFLPAMIISYRIMLFQSDFILKIILP